MSQNRNNSQRTKLNVLHSPSEQQATSLGPIRINGSGGGNSGTKVSTKADSFQCHSSSSASSSPSLSSSRHSGLSLGGGGVSSQHQRPDHQSQSFSRANYGAVQVIQANPVNSSPISVRHSFRVASNGNGSSNYANQIIINKSRPSSSASAKSHNSNSRSNDDPRVPVMSAGNRQQSQPNYDNLISVLQSSSQSFLGPSLDRNSIGRASLGHGRCGSSNSVHIANHASISSPMYGQINSSTSMSGSSRTSNSVQDREVRGIDDGTRNKRHSFSWVEIFEPRSKTKMFANLSTGECRWDEPKGVVNILRASDPNVTQWWELYDQKSQRFYYYSAKDFQTIWQKPTSKDAVVVPLAKLQILKQNTQDCVSNVDNGNSPSAGGSVSSGHVTPNSSLSSPSSHGCCSVGGARCPQARTNGSMVDASTQTTVNPMSLTKPTMVSRWTQTTNITSTNVRLDEQRNDSVSNPHARGNRNAAINVQSSSSIRPSLHHYLLSEARFARGITTSSNGPPTGQFDQLYDQVVNEDFYDMVPNDANYYDVYEDGDDRIIDFDDEVDDSDIDSYCDADDEYDLESYDEDEDEEEMDGEEVELEDDDSEELEEDSSEEEIVGTGSGLGDYDPVELYSARGDFDDFSRGNVPRAPPHLATGGHQQSIDPNKQDLDGLRMSASFTAVDFKRNAVGRSSYTPSLHQHYQQQSQLQTSASYSNPFNTGSLRSSTGRIPHSTTSSGTRSSNIADRINLFNQKSTQPQTSVGAAVRTSSSPTSAIDSIKQGPRTRYSTSTVTDSALNNLNNAQRYLQPSALQSSSSLGSPQSSAPSKSHSLTMISQAQGGSPNDHITTTTTSSIGGGGSVSKVVGTALANLSLSPKLSPVQDYEQLSSSQSHGAPNTTSKRNNLARHSANSFDGNNTEKGSYSRNTSTTTANASSDVPGTYQVHQQGQQVQMSNSSSAMFGRSQFSGFNDSHMVMLNKTASRQVALGHSTSQPLYSKQQLPAPHTATAKKSGDKGDSDIVKSKKKSSKVKTLETAPVASPKKKKKSKTTLSTTDSNKKENIGPQSTNGTGPNNSIESFARECVSRHRKGGIFSKKKTLKSMLTHTKKPLKKPMISTISDGILVKESVSCFKLIQLFMGDRPVSPAGSGDVGSGGGVTGAQAASDEQLLVRLINVCVQLVPLRDEVLVQVARQVTQNPSPDSEQRGLELMCVLFWYFTASNKLASHLHAFLAGHRNPFTAVVRRKFEQQLNRSRHTHSHLFFRKPHSPDEVARVLRCVRAQHVGVFGETLEDAIVSTEVLNHANREHKITWMNSLKQLPWPIVMLTEALLEPRHEDREGVFRCVGDMDDVHRLKMKIDTTLPTDANFVQLIGRGESTSHGTKLTDAHDIHVIGSTIKLYFRELRDSVIPMELYLEALDCAHSASRVGTLLDKLSATNRNTLLYLIQFLQIFSTPEHVHDTKMDDANLSMVWAPNILRSPLNSTTNSANIYEHTRAEMSLVRTMIQHVNTDNLITKV